MTFQSLTSTFTQSIFSWDYFSDFEKIWKNTFEVKIQLNILNALLGEQDIESKFISLVRQYPETRKVLPLLIAVRTCDKEILNKETLEIKEMKHLFQPKKDFENSDMIDFFVQTGLKKVFQNKQITNLSDYIFWVETWLDSNARKNRTGDLMEDLVEEFVKEYCETHPWFLYKEQATKKYMQETWRISIESDKSSRRFDFAIYDSNTHKVYLLEVNYYGGGWSKLKAVAWEFAGLYDFMKSQNVPFFWFTDGLGWFTALNPLEDAYKKMDGNIYNLWDLKDGILDEIIR